jgi:uncharacterized protein YjbI with pentapeptide repeats
VRLLGHDDRVPPTGRRRQALMLTGTLALAAGVTAGITVWVLRSDPGTGVSEALRTGGLAGASVVALYALWLNDRRRRVEEDRQAVEEERLRVEGERIVNERFARAIELLGNDADQVRVGALHALVGLARGTPSYAQTVIDVLCAYLRRPFFHNAYTREGHDPDRPDFAKPARGRLSEEEAADDRERQVRLTAQRVLLDLLPAVGTDGPRYDLDLTGASLEYLDLERRQFGGLRARRATFYGITRLSGAEFGGRAMFTGSVFGGRIELRGVRFRAGLSLQEVRFDGAVDLTGAVVEDFADLRWLEPATVDVAGVVPGKGVLLKLLPGIELAPSA